MKFLIVSDIHGSFYYTKKLQEVIEKEKPDKIIFLGDLYYHGPRNPLPKDYNPMQVCQFFNSIKNKLIAIKGNCDAEVDEMISDFKFKKTYSFKCGTHSVFISHGHIYNADNPPKTNYDIMLYGHLHTGFIIQKNNKIYANPGSLSLPKNGTTNSYIILDENKITLKDINGKIIQALNLN